MVGLGRSLLAGGGDEDGHGGHPFTFEDVLALCACLWLAVLGGRAATRVGLPALVGEIFAGILFGPHGIDLAPKPDALMLVGELGLCLMVIEAGLEVDLSQLALVGARGVVVAVAGSFVPLGIGAALAAGVFNLDAKPALAVGASLAPTSMGISLKVLQEGGVLNTPTGQLIIAAAVIDDVIALVLLSELKALDKDSPTALDFIVPVLASGAFIVGVGFAAVRLVPGFLAKVVVPRLPATVVAPTLLGCVLASSIGLMAACYYGKSSYLLGAFLGGLCFCTLASIEHVWKAKVKWLMHWLIKIFFSCTIGFEVPIRDLWTGKVLSRAAVFLAAGIGKVATGAFAKPFMIRDAAMIGFAMSAWGEFAFIVATASREAGTLDEDSYGAVVLAVLLSAVYSPFAVKYACEMSHGRKSNLFKSFIERRKQIGSASTHGQSSSDIKLEVDDGEPGDRQLHHLHHVYYACCIRCRSTWGLTDRIFAALRDTMDVVDFRIHTRGGWSLLELYLRDRLISAPAEDVPGPHADEIESTIANMSAKLRTVAGVGTGGDVEGADNTGDVLLERWLPTLDDEHPEDDDEEAFKQAEEVFHDEYPEEETMDQIEDTFELGRVQTRLTGSLANLQNALQSDNDASLLGALVKGKEEMENQRRGQQDGLVLGAARYVLDRAPSNLSASSFEQRFSHVMRSSREGGSGVHRLGRRRHRRALSLGDGGIMSGQESIISDSVSDVSAPVDLAPMMGGGARDHTLSTVTLSGAMGSQLALEVKQNMKNMDRKRNAL